MFYNAITYRASYTEDKAEYVSLNDCLIIDYDEFKSILKDSKFCWCNLGRHLSLNLENIHTIRIY